MMMTNGFGATIGVLAAQAIVNHYCQYNATGHLVGDWTSVWYIFAGFALLVAIAFTLIFREAKK
jgi:NHS family nucleoside permease-like MFS transporter